MLCKAHRQVIALKSSSARGVRRQFGESCDLCDGGEPTPLPQVGAVAWNPSVTGGGKSEDTVLVTADGCDVLTRTPELGELKTRSLPRPAIVEL